jgi:hypothetical protein
VEVKVADSAFDVGQVTVEGFFDAIGARHLEHTRFALLTGSHIERLATSTSDLDALLVVDAPTHAYLSEHNAAPVTVSGMRVDVQLMSDRQFDGLIDTARQGIANLHPRSLILLHKAVFGKALVGDENRRRRLGKIDAAVFRAGVRDYHLKVANDEYANLVGFVEGQHLLACADAVRIYARTHVDAYLASAGDAYPAPKWRIRKLERTVRATRPARYDEIIGIEVGSGSADHACLKRWIATSLVTIRRIQFELYFGAAHAAHLDRDATRHARQDYRQRDEPLSFASVERINGQFVARNLRADLVLTPLLAMVLLGSAWDVSNAALAQVVATSGVKADATPEMIGKCRTTLRARGLIAAA